ncbi:hypothetical protein GJ496_007148 [Pomphorhynchus laevis]|nr:hypothetical protein GJ496_007148 [Pomphorhynchus laevis]
MNVSPTRVMVRNHLSYSDQPDKVRGVYAYPVSEKERMYIVYGLNIVPLLDGLNEFAQSRCKCRLCLDFSKFDKTVPLFIIKYALTIIRELLDTSEYTDGTQVQGDVNILLDLVEDYFINTPLVLTDGKLYVKKGGIPSGSLLTNLIGSISNALISTYIHFKYWKNQDVQDGMILSFDRSSFFGDDSVLSLPLNSPMEVFSLDDISRQFNDEFGMAINTDKSQIAKFCPDKDVTTLLWALAYPEHTDRSVLEFYQRLVGVSYAGGYNNEFRQMCCEVEKLIIRKHSSDVQSMVIKKSTDRWLKALGVGTLTDFRCATAADIKRLFSRNTVLPGATNMTKEVDVRRGIG